MRICTPLTAKSSLFLAPPQSNTRKQPKMADTLQNPISKPHSIITNHQENYNHPNDPFSSFHDLYLPLVASTTTPNFNLEKAVCSHGLFMMAPNKWDPHTKSLLRPLRLSHGGACALTRVSQLPQALVIRVYGTRHLCTADEVAVVGQVRRMLRLSETEERKVIEFQEMNVEAKEKGFGRIFRSPTLFEDMVKCILFCNCQWPRTLSMAQALCDLQLELQCPSSRASINAAKDTISKASAKETSNFIPATPAKKESKSKYKKQKVSEVGANTDADSKASMDYGQKSNGIDLVENFVSPNNVENGDWNCVSSSKDEISDGLDSKNNAYLEGKETTTHLMGNFPSPEEIASLDEKYLSKHCGLGYRAGRILKLAQGIVEGRIQLSELEELSNDASLLNYDKLNEKLKEIHGYGPFTRDNVLMCMGFYNIVPTDSETIRHLQQVHARKTTIKTVKEVVDEIYGKYEPFQFLAYWLEIWTFYEDWFGKLSEMPASDYRLITASNMRINKGKHINHKI